MERKITNQFEIRGYYFNHRGNIVVELSTGNDHVINNAAFEQWLMMNDNLAYEYKDIDEEGITREDVIMLTVEQFWESRCIHIHRVLGKYMSEELKPVKVFDSILGGLIKVCDSVMPVRYKAADFQTIDI